MKSFHIIVLMLLSMSANAQNLNNQPLQNGAMGIATAASTNLYEGISFSPDQSQMIMKIHLKQAEDFKREEQKRQQEIAKILTPEQRQVFEKNKSKAN